MPNAVWLETDEAGAASKLRIWEGETGCLIETFCGFHPGRCRNDAFRSATTISSQLLHLHPMQDNLSNLLDPASTLWSNILLMCGLRFSRRKLWNMTPCSLVDWHRSFGGTCCLNSVKWKWRQTLSSKCSCQSTTIFSATSQEIFIFSF
jgi:hypothetical protein